MDGGEGVSAPSAADAAAMAGGEGVSAPSAATDAAAAGDQGDGEEAAKWRSADNSTTINQ